MDFVWEQCQKKTFRYLTHRWGVSGLHKKVNVQFSPRMTTSLGRCYPVRKLIRLNSVLDDPRNRELLAETLCHEMAHVAVFSLHEKKVKPHGVEWQALMRMAGYEPRVSIDAKEIAGHKRRTTISKYIYTHYCPRCKIKFIAGRTDRRWRCESCSREKQPGVLLVSKRLRD